MSTHREHTHLSARLVFWMGLATLVLLTGCKLVSEGLSFLPFRLTPLDAETLEQLRLSTGERSQAQPGEILDLAVGLEQCCYFFEEAPVRVRWSVSPQEGASIDARTGELSISPTASAGAVFVVEAEVEGGKRVLRGEVYIYTPAANPLVGVWREQGRTNCASGVLEEAQEPVRELVFKADGTYTVTWHPFEIYHDYWGSYTFDAASGNLTLQIEGGNYLPTETDLEGQFSLDESGALWLKDLWLGGREEADIPACGYLFAH